MLDNNIKTLIKILEESNIDELEVSTFWGRQKIRIRQSIPSNDINVDVKSNSSKHIRVEEEILRNESHEIETEEIIKPKSIEKTIEQEYDFKDDNTITLKAPLVGTFYKSAKPDMPPFVSIGDTIKEGQVICIIEAMKIFNEIESEHSGKILKILVEDGSPVEYDQDLLIITPE